MSTNECRFIATLMMLELLVTALFLAAIAFCAYSRRFFTKKSLNGSTVLITNGSSNLSLSLAKQLTRVHKCKVILVKSPASSNNNEVHRTKCQVAPNISTFECDVLASSQMDELSKTIDKFYAGIDLIVDNGLTEHASHRQHPDDFITSSSNCLRATVNLLMFFVPKMKYSAGGHVVSIQSAASGSPRPLIDTRGEIQRVVRLLTTNDVDPSMGNVHVQLTTVLCDRTATGSHSDGKVSNLTNATEQIINGIRRDRSLVQIKTPTSLIQTIFNFFPKIV